MVMSETIALDVGNSHVAFYRQAQADAGHRSISRIGGLDTALAAAVERGESEFPQILLGQSGDPWEDTLGVEPRQWWVASVRPALADQLQAGLHRWRPQDHWVPIRPEWIPLPDQLVNRSATGIDRLLVAWYAAYHRPGQLRPGSGTIVVDVGSAVTVDWVDPAGVFRGGMIYPGFRLAAEALDRGTAALPLVAPVAAPPLGRDTIGALQAGLFWSQWGGLRQCVAQVQTWALNPRTAESNIGGQGPELPDPEVATESDAAVVVTGGGARLFQPLFPSSWHYEADLLPKAIFLLAQQMHSNQRNLHT